MDISLSLIFFTTIKFKGNVKDILSDQDQAVGISYFRK